MRQRKSYLVSLKPQSDIIIGGLLVQFVTFFLLYLINNYTFGNLINSDINTLTVNGIADSDFLVVLRDNINLSLMFAAAVSTSGYFLIMLLLSHRLVGPAYKMTEILKKINNENVYPESEIQLRKNDFFHDLAEQLNIYLKLKK